MLGLVWNRSSDCFGYDTQSFLEYCKNYGHHTKRSLLSASARIFDPLGLISPITLLPKILLQKIWTLGLGWDDELPIELKKQWMEWSEGFHRLSELKISRFYFLDQLEDREVQLHLFSDASLAAYGTVAYLRSVDSSGYCRVTCIASKTRVAPLQQMTLPRLELMGCLLSARLAKSIGDALSLQFPTLYWSDSQVALSWISKTPSALKQFVGNRVQEIQRLSTPANWRFVPGKENPADLCSRGVPTSALLDEDCIWWRGPDWLRQPESTWALNSKPMETTAECRIERTHATVLLAKAYVRRRRIQHSSPTPPLHSLRPPKLWKCCRRSSKPPGIAP